MAEVEVLEPGLYKGQVTRPLRAPGRNYGGRYEVIGKEQLGGRGGVDASGAPCPQPLLYSSLPAFLSHPSSRTNSSFFRVEVLEVPAIEAAETPKPTVEVKDTSGEGPSVLQEGDFPVLGNVKRSSDAPPEATQWSKSPVASAAEAAPSKKAAAPAAKGDKKGGIQVGKTLPFGIRGTLERDADPQV